MKNRFNEVLLITFVPALVFTLLSLFLVSLSPLKETDFLSEIRKTFPQSAPSTIQPPLIVFDAKKSGETDTLIPVQADSSAIAFGDLSRFMLALKQLKQQAKTIHIAYFGDSMIEGDLLTHDLRSALQKTFGGSGVGFVPVTSATAGFRVTIRHTFNDSWSVWHFNEPPPSGKFLGPSGYLFRGQPGANVSYTSSAYYRPFSVASLFYSSESSSELSVRCDTAGSNLSLDETGNEIREVILHDSAVFNRLQVTVKNGNPFLYGFNFENGPGLYVDNYSFRGNSGIALSSVKERIFHTFDSLLNYRLVVLHYGLNVVAHDKKDYSWYERSFRKTLRHIRAAFPEAAILLVSVGDKAYHSYGQWNTEPDIPLFVNLQARLAAEEGIAFWNLYRAMGGYNSMKRWVEEEKPRLANLDYTHTNHKGAARIGAMLYNHLFEAYRKFEQDSDSSYSHLGLSTVSPYVQ